MPYWKTQHWQKKPKIKVQTSPIDLAERRAWGWFSKYIRLRDCIATTNTKVCFKCISCKKITPFEGNDAGHFITIANKATKFDERNVHAQCSQCNRFKQGCWDQMYTAILAKHDQATIDDLLALRFALTKNVDYSELSDKYRLLYNNLKKCTLSRKNATMP